MVWGLWILAIVLFMSVWLLYWLEEGRGHGATYEYRQKYIRLVERLEVVVGLANKLEHPANSARDIRILDSYLGSLRMLETLMGAVRSLDPFGTQAGILQAPTFLVTDIQDRFKQLDTQLTAHLKGKAFKAKSESETPYLGCYFCSRPFEPALFHKVRVKIDGSSSDVTACKTCRDRLTDGKKARVLFFDEDGRAVHWTKAKGYVPSERYWTINADEPAPSLNTGTHLTLVHSSATPLSSHGRSDF